MWVLFNVQQLWLLYRILLYYVARSELFVFFFSLHVAVGLARTMELVYQSMRRTALCASALENSQGKLAKQVRKSYTLIAFSTKNQNKW